MRLIADLAPCDPAMGLAIDEILFEVARGGAGPVLRLWVNDWAVVIGRAQGIASEVDVRRAEALSIPVLRRISGGGAVAHYPGNLNVTAIESARDAGSVEECFARWGSRIREGLEALPIDVDVEGNCLLVDGRKVGGAAQARRGGAVLYHTTLLVSPPERPLFHLLLAGQPEYRPTGIPSCPRPTTTLSEAAGHEIPSATVAEAVRSSVGDDTPLRTGPLTVEEEARARALTAAKYGRSSWNASR